MCRWKSALTETQSILKLLALIKEGCTSQCVKVFLDSEHQIRTCVDYIKNGELNEAKVQLCYVKLGGGVGG